MAQISLQNIGSLEIDHRSSSISRAIYPCLTFRFDARAASNEKVIISGMNLRLFIKDKSRGDESLIGTLVPLKSLYTIPPVSSSLEFNVDLDHYKLKKIEEIRSGTDLDLEIKGSLILEREGQPQNRANADISGLCFTIPKSDWVEKILPSLNLKNVSLIEIPKIDPNFKEIAEHLNLAWQQHFHGKYNLALTECRKALEALSRDLRERGFEKEITTKKGETKKVPDFGALLGDKKIGNRIGTTFQKTYGFASPGAHTGSTINKEHSDYTVLVTQAIIHLVLTKLSELPK